MGDETVSGRKDSLVGGAGRVQRLKEDFMKLYLITTSPSDISIKYSFLLHALWNQICFMVVFKSCFQ